MGREARRVKTLDTCTRLRQWLGVFSKCLVGRENGDCHLITRIAAESLRRHGFTVEPTSVYIEVVPTHTWSRARHLLTEIVAGVSPLTRTPVPPGLWFGHLVLIVDGAWLIDVALEQYSTPDAGIIVPPSIVMSWLPIPQKQQATIREVIVTYWLRPDDDHAWRETWEAGYPTDEIREHCDVIDRNWQANAYA